MITSSGRLFIDTSFISQLSYLPSKIERAAKVATWKTNAWLRLTSLRELGVELKIKNFSKRWRVYKDGSRKLTGASRWKPYRSKKMNGQMRMFSSKLWVGTYKIGVHRLGRPTQLSGSDVLDGRGNIHDHSFIMSRGGQPLVFRRYNWNNPNASPRVRRKIRLESVDIYQEVKEQLDALAPTLDRKFKGFFFDELNRIL